MPTMRLTAFPLALAALLLAAAPAAAAPPAPSERIELTQMMGRWYEIARLPNKMQSGCQGGTSEWTRAAGGYSVVQRCHKAGLSKPPTEWKATARVMDPATNAKLQMSFFGGLVKQEYWVLDHQPDQGWLVLGTPGGNYVWLMAERPTLPANVRTQALARLRQLGYDVGRLEFPQPARN
ncbi:MAG: lipocalin family protein [Phenylobacterium sp.]|jgi:apolipoprotein D and lipocalin family protein|uniref:lipocalin family protein n=1 Tax=Phenylobacterium sp. TaxID=1871053 RepID=UPI00391A1E05